MNRLTYKDVQNFLIEASFEFSPSQNEICFPILERIHKRLQDGHRFSPIDVTPDGIISDGHHRYICLQLLNIDIVKKPAGKNHNQLVFEWKNVDLVTIDYDSPEEIQNYIKRYD